MQCKFLIAFVLMGACLIQATSADPLIIGGGLQASGIFETPIEAAKEIIARLTALIQQKINEALNTINELKYKVGEQVSKSIEVMKQKLQEIFKKAQQTIEKIEERAKQAGIDITNCVKDSDGKLQELFQKFLADEIHCVTGEVDKVMKMITETIQMITDTMETVKKLPNDLKDCLSSKTPISCIGKVSINAVKMEKDLPMKIAKKVQEVTEFVAGLQTRLEVCAASQLTNAGISVAGIVGDVVKCAAEKGLEGLNI